ncbi:RIP metalloprotease RseP [Saccharicrinis sp. FJH62]|uniref:RIP metalloprotease RseP n=1 Tax=Saccharicrinis sp. FJH62 TaxID=3344657 RepID=UPI0035D44760
MTILIQALQLIASLSILVMIHEFGHFLFARIFKTRVEKFRLFFDPWFAIWKKKIGETEYGIGWLPLGGYVKIAGMIDESMDKEQMKQPPQPYEFRSKPSWQRLLIMIGGVLFNVLLAFFIYTMVLWTWGEQYLPTQNMKYGVSVNQTAYDMGFRDGDKIVNVDGEEVPSFSKIVPTIILDHAKYVTVDRDGKTLKVPISDENFAKLIGEDKTPLFDLRTPFVIAKFVDDAPAEKAGLKEEDKLVAFNGHPLEFYDMFTDSLSKYAGKTVGITVDRDGVQKTFNVTLTDEGKLGIYAHHPSEFYDFSTEKFTFLESIPAGINKGVQSITDYLKQFKLIFAPETKAYKQLGGFIKIGSIFPPVWDWYSFWTLTAFLSIILAIMNLLPIPALDGGHVVILLYEMVTGRTPSEKFLEYAQIAGMVIIFSLLIYANMNDVIGLFK